MCVATLALVWNNDLEVVTDCCTLFELEIVRKSSRSHNIATLKRLTEYAIGKRPPVLCNSSYSSPRIFTKDSNMYKKGRKTVATSQKPSQILIPTDFLQLFLCASIFLCVSFAQSGKIIKSGGKGGRLKGSPVRALTLDYLKGGAWGKNKSRLSTHMSLKEL